MKNFIIRSIGTKLITAYLLVSIIPIIIIGLISYYSSKNALKTEIDNNISSLVHSRAYHIENFISISQDMIVSASSVNMFRENLYKVKKGIDVKNSISVLAEAIKAWQSNSTVFYRAKILNLDGVVIATTMSGLNDIGANRSNKDYFKKGLKEPYISDPYFSSDDSVASIAFSCPVYAPGSKTKIVGVIVLYNAMMPKFINNKVSVINKSVDQITTNTEGLGNSGQTYLVSQEGLILSTTRFGGDLFLKGKMDKESLTNLLRSDGTNLFTNTEGKTCVGMAERIKGTNWILIVEYDYKEVFSPVKNLQKLIAILGCIVLIIVFILAYFISEYFRKPIVELTNTTKAIERGDLDQQISVRTQDEIGILAESFNKMQYNLKKVVEHANFIAEGDYSGSIDPKSEKDVLAISLNKMTIALNKMSAENDRSDWLKTGQNELSNTLRGIEDPQILCTNVISFLTKYLNAQIGACYLYDEDANNLVLTASYAYSDGKKLMFPGEGLIGQSIIDKKTILITDVPDSYFLINSALGNAKPKNIVVIPLINTQNPEGVIEIGSFNEFSARDLELIELVSDSITKSISAVKAIQKQSLLLSELKIKRMELSGQILAISRSNIAMEYDIDGNIIKANKLFLDLYGYTEEEITGKHQSMILDETSINSEEYKNLWDNLRNGLFQQGEFKRKTKTGDIIWLQGSFSPVLNEEGKPYKVIGIAQDITSIKNQQKLLEEQKEELEVQQMKLAETNAELEIQTEKISASEEELRVQHEIIQNVNLELEEQTQLLEEKNLAVNETNMAIERFRTELEQKAEALEVTSKFKSEFLANMSHELRTPLNSILLLSKLLAGNKENNLTADQIEYSKVINSSGHGLLELINEILDLSKIEAGKMDIDLVIIPIRDIADNLNSIFKPLAQSKGIELVISVDQLLPDTFETDRMRLEQILRNLLSNALKFTEKGSVKLSITEQNNKIAFAITDSGIGIPKDKQELIFEAFQQADGSTKRKYGGTGLGLSISRELAKLLGGELILDSEEGKGSTFTLLLPFKSELKSEKTDYSEIKNFQVEDKLSKPEEIKSKSKYIVKDIPSEIPDDRNDITAQDKVILIVEDDVIFANILLQSINEMGYKGIVIVRGDFAITFAEKYNPAGILLDLQLPIMDGWSVMDQLKTNDKTKHIPVHMMSAYDGKKESLDRGAIDFISKPFAIDKLAEAIRRIESIGNKGKKKLLIIEDSETHSKAISEFLQAPDVECLNTNTTIEGMKILEKEDIDCVILDMALPDTLGYDVMESIRNNPKYEQLPIIVYTGKSLSIDEENKLKKFASAIIIKTAESYERLLDETTLFLHLIKRKSDEEEDRPKKPYFSNSVLENKTVLIVDDDMRNVYSITKSLENYKMKVITAGTGIEALEQLNNNTEIEIILMDLMMPGMDGLEAMKEIRKIDQFKKLPIIAVTAKAMLGDRVKCIEAGASDYISKPVDIDQLISLIRVWLYK